MRLFVGIPLNEACHHVLSDVQQSIKPKMKRGRFTDSTLFHLTLLFIGEVEVEHLAIIQKTLKESLQTYSTFTLALGRIGTFQKGTESVLWVGIHQPPHVLFEIASRIRTNLNRAKIITSDQTFNPHITLGRQIVFHNHTTLDCNDIPSIRFDVDRIHLYVSHQVEGKLTYTPLDTYHLK